MNVTAALPVLLALIVVIAWAVVLVARKKRHAHEGARAGEVDVAFTLFVEQSLELGSLAEVLTAAAEAARRAFGARKVVLFEPGGREGQWDTVVDGTIVDQVPEAERGIFGWFKHNASVIAIGDLAEPRYGAMRVPLGSLAKRHEADVIVPLVDRGQTLGAIALSLGRRPGKAERDLLQIYRQEVTAAAANVRLHREAAHKLTLEKEVDLASAVQVALVPPVADGRAGAFTWAGHYRSAGQVGSDFWSAYDLGHDRVLVVVGDVVGTGLAGSMASAVAKSCCDALVNAGAAVEPGTLLATLNRALFRPNRPLHMTCFAALFDGRAGKVTWANAGHVLPYHAAAAGLGVLGGAGPMLGDAADVKYQMHTRALAPGDAFVLFTDGLSEAMNADRIAFGERRLQRTLARATNGAGGGPRDVLRAVLEAVEAFRGGVKPVDDEALVVVRVA